MKNNDFLELVLEYFISDFRDVFDLSNDLIERKFLSTDTYRVVSLNDLGLDKESPKLKEDLDKLLKIR